MISLWNTFAKYTAAPRIDASAAGKDEATASQLLRLPPELILSVAQMLPIPSAVCFALCNRRLNSTLGPGLYGTLQNEAPETQLAFLSFLAKDLPQHFVCLECACLHRLSAIKWPPLTTNHLGARCTWRWQSKDYRPRFFSPYRIYFPHIQLAMKQHYSNNDIGFPIEAFQYLEVEYTCAQQKTTLLSVDAQIVSNDLLIRAQTWSLLPWSKRNEFLAGLPETGLSFDICMHTRDRYMNKDLIANLVRSRFDQLEAREKSDVPTLQCPYCWLDYELDTIDFGERGFAVLVTRWINLGAGLDSTDTKWQSHVTGPVAGAGNAYHPRAQGEIRNGFEGQAELSLEELTVDNRMKLFSRRYSSIVRRGSDGLAWKWDRGNRWYLSPSGPPEKSFWEIYGLPNTSFPF